MRLKISMLVAAGMAMALSANATLIGKTVEGVYKLNPPVSGSGFPPPPDPFPENYFEVANGGSGKTAVVGSGLEFYRSAGIFRVDADLTADKLILDYEWDDQAGPAYAQHIQHFVSFEIVDWAGPVGTIVGFDLVGGAADPLLDYEYTGNRLQVQFDTFFDPNAGSFHLEFDIDVEYPTNDPVPEPATMTLLGLGLAGLAWRKREA